MQQIMGGMRAVFDCTIPICGTRTGRRQGLRTRIPEFQKGIHRRGDQNLTQFVRLGIAEGLVVVAPRVETHGAPQCRRRAVHQVLLGHGFAELLCHTQKHRSRAGRWASDPAMQ